MNVSAGKLRHRIRIEVPVQSRNEVTGAVDVTWNTLYSTVPCSIEPLSVKDFIQSQAKQAGIVARIVFRYLQNIPTDARFVALCGCHDGEIYNPEGLLRDAESGMSYITAPCSTGVNTGDV